MAKPRKLPSGLWFVQINRRGHRPSKAFASKTAATVWASETERAILDGTFGTVPQDKTLADLGWDGSSPVATVALELTPDGRRIADVSFILRGTLAEGYLSIQAAKTWTDARKSITLRIAIPASRTISSPRWPARRWPKRTHQSIARSPPA